MKANDITGQKFGKLTVLHRVSGGSSKWLCQCECGNTKEIYATNLMNGRSSSCGCTRLRHGDSKSKLYGIHSQMLRIGICDEWRDYVVFKEWTAANGWEEGVKIKRKDITQPYSPDNCEIRK